MFIRSVLIFFVFIASNYGFKLHDQMTPEEVQLIFRTKREDVPEYEVVPIRHGIHENSPADSPHRILEIRSFNRDIKLYLEPTEGYLASNDIPIWKAEGDPSSPEGIRYTKVLGRVEKHSYFYQDPHNLAAIHCTHDEHGQALYEGTIGNDLVLRPVPDRFRNGFLKGKRNANDDESPASNRTVYHPNLKRTYHHIVFKNKEVSVDRMREKIGSYVLNDNLPRVKRSTEERLVPPETIYPQVLVIVDYDEFLALQTLVEVKRYIISFWNAVDLRFRVLMKPQVRLNIAGIIIATKPDGAPFIQNHRTRPVDGPIVDADKALDGLGYYFYNETTSEKLHRFSLEKDFDLVMAMTRLDLCNYEPTDKDFDCTTLGYAFRGGSCTLNEKKAMVEAVSIIEDNGGYTGILSAAHEVGHLFGAPHDGKEIPNKPLCPKYGGYIMTDNLMMTPNGFTWSYCSMVFFDEFLHSNEAQCLFNEPRNRKPAKLNLPGQILSLDEQCDRTKGTYACNKDKTACAHLDCFVPDSGGQCLPDAPAAEGSDCGTGRWCINGDCILKNATQVQLQFAPPPIDYEAEDEDAIWVPSYEDLESDTPIVVERS